jgi:hypothetical protein
MGLKDRREIRLLAAWRDRFIQLQRLIVPTVATLVLIGEACLRLKSTGKLDPTHPKHCNDVTIAAAARQIGATIITKTQNIFRSSNLLLTFILKG